MKSQKYTFARPGPVTCLVLLVSGVMALAQSDKYACTEPNPQSVCNTGNTCGSASSHCTVDVKRDDYGASATPGIAGAKGNSTFGVKTGTTIVWESTQKNTGFVVDFGSSSPFGSDDAIIGGAKKPVSVTAIPFPVGSRECAAQGLPRPSCCRQALTRDQSPDTC
jgi:hypothetical protein